MLKRFIKARSVFMIFSLAMFVALPLQTTKADVASCVIAVAEAARAQADMQTACSSFGSGSIACSMARQNFAGLMATATNECT